MQVTPADPPAKQVIERYGVSGFRINGVHYATPVLVLPDRVETWLASGFEALTIETLRPVLDNSGIEILLIGSGRRTEPLQRAIKAALKAAGISAEVMDTGAACRTYSVLLLEGRRVAAALQPLTV